MEDIATLRLNNENLLGYFSLQKFCTCTGNTLSALTPKNLQETIPALEALCQPIIYPLIGNQGFLVDVPGV